MSFYSLQTFESDPNANRRETVMMAPKPQPMPERVPMPDPRLSKPTTAPTATMPVKNMTNPTVGKPMKPAVMPSLGKVRDEPQGDITTTKKPKQDGTGFVTQYCSIVKKEENVASEIARLRAFKKAEEEARIEREQMKKSVETVNEHEKQKKEDALKKLEDQKKAAAEKEAAAKKEAEQAKAKEAAEKKAQEKIDAAKKEADNKNKLTGADVPVNTGKIDANNEKINKLKKENENKAVDNKIETEKKT